MTWTCPVCQLDWPEPFCDQCTTNLMALPALVCSWCTRTIREGAEPVSHGICADCAATKFPRITSRRPSLTFAGEGRGVRQEDSR